MKKYVVAFDEGMQNEMREFFCKLAEKGIKKQIKKNENISFNPESEFGIVLSGTVAETFISNEGDQKQLYFLVRGEVFGELNFIEKTPLDTYIYAREDSVVSIVNGKELMESIKEDYLNFKYIYHSLYRKYQVSKYQMLNLVFTDSVTNVADTLLRLIYSQFKSNEEIPEIKITQQHLSELIGCNRITVTKSLNYLKEKGIIETESKSIRILNLEALQEIVDSV